jgi:exopolysaccharide production protein ExoQ
MRAELASHSVSSQTAVPTLQLPQMIGFFFAVRLIFVLLAVRVFGQEAQVAVESSLALNYLLLFVVVFHSYGTRSRGAHSYGVCRQSLRLKIGTPPARWALIYLTMTCASLLWTGAASLPAAIAFWCAMAADSAMVVLLLRTGQTDLTVTSLMKGYVWGATSIAVTAWLLPSQSDLRLGDETLLGPNQIGFVCAFAFFFAQYLIRGKHGNWTLHAALLAVTLLRSLSKTTIVAFVLAQCFILLRDRTIRPKTKRVLVLSALFILALFLRLLVSYSDVYLNAGNQSETLTGRVGIWAYFLVEAMQQPWIGHGFHSVWKIVPPFGPDQFEARHAHNELLQQFYAYGLMGVLVLISLYTSLYRSFRSVCETSLKVYLQGLLIFVLVRGLADTKAFELSLPMWTIFMIDSILRQSYGQTEVRA